MALNFLRLRLFSNVTRTNKYATKQMKEDAVWKKKIQSNNKVVDGMNSFNTNFL